MCELTKAITFLEENRKSLLGPGQRDGTGMKGLALCVAVVTTDPGSNPQHYIWSPENH